MSSDSPLALSLSAATNLTGLSEGPAAPEGRYVRVYPPCVEFQGVQPGLLYVITVSVQNVSTRTRKIAITAPSTTHFRLNYDPAEAVPPGLEVQCEVLFQMGPEERDYHDYMVVRCVSDDGRGEERIEVPLHARVPAPDICFDGFVHLGTVVLENTTGTFVEFENRGFRRGRYSIRTDPSLPLRIAPAEGVLHPTASYVDADGDGRLAQDELVKNGKSKQRVRIELTGKELGPFRALVRVEVDGQAPKMLDINATVVEQRLELVLPDNGGPVTAMPFGTLYFGQARTLETLLVNNGPMPVSYSVALNDVELSGLGAQAVAAAAASAAPSKASGRASAASMASSASAASVGSKAGAGAGAGAEGKDGEDSKGGVPQAVTVAPMEAVIQPYSSLPLSFHFAPQMPEFARGFKSTINKLLAPPSAAATPAGGGAGADAKDAPPPQDTAMQLGLTATVECSETKQSIPVSVSARAVRAALEVSRRVIKFGECPVNERRDVVVTIRNTGELPVEYSLTRVANFHAKPARGRLQPMQSQSTVITFAPAQLGKFRNSLHLVAGDGLQAIVLRCSGTSHTLGARKQLVKGIDKKKEDFKPQHHFIEPQEEDQQTQAQPKFTRLQPWEMPIDAAGVLREGEYSTDPTLTFNVTELAQRAEMRHKYNGVLAQRREERLKKQAATATKRREAKMRERNPEIHVDPEVDLGMGRELPSPTPPLPPANDELWLERPIDGSSTAAARKRGRLLQDENRLIKKKFKPKPTTQSEVRDCAAQLSPTDLHAISAGPKVLDFGRVCINSVTSKSFTVTNDLAQCVLVAVQHADEALRQSTPQSQVIPAGATAGFDITFCSRNEQNFRKAITYVINDHHSFKFTIAAQVVPITVELNPPQMTFQFPDNNLDPALTQTLTLSNPGNAPCDCVWQVGKKGAFSVDAEEVHLEPDSWRDVHVTFRPQPNCRNEDTLVLRVAGGDDQELQCRGVIDETRCSFAERRVDFGVVPAGVQRDKTAVLRNTGQAPAVFIVDPLPASSGMTVSPARGRIGVGDTQDIVVSLKAPRAKRYEGVSVLVHIRGGRTVRLPVIAEAVVPQVEVEQDEFDFDQVTLGAAVRLPVTIKNTGNIAATLIMNLDEHPEFSIEPRASSDGDESAADVRAMVVPVTPAVPPPMPSSSEEGQPDEPQCTRWRLNAQPHTDLLLDLVFSPTAVTQHAFELDLSLVGIPSSAALRRAVLAEGLKPRLLLSRTVLDFGERVVSRDHLKKIPYSAEVQLANDERVGLTWELDLNRLAQDDRVRGVFHVAPAAGELAPGDSAVVRVSFLPGDESEYETEIPIYLDGQRERAYLNLRVRGSGIYPHLSFDRPDGVVLPTVPLNVRSRTVFYVINTGYDNLDLRFRLPVDTQRCPLQLDFPEGRTVGIAQERLPVEISFVSRKAMSFTGKVDFFDANSNRFSISVTGTADNCLLTNYPFVAAYHRHYRYHARPQRPVMLLDHAQARTADEAEGGGGGETKASDSVMPLELDPVTGQHVQPSLVVPLPVDPEQEELEAEARANRRRADTDAQPQDGDELQLLQPEDDLLMDGEDGDEPHEDEREKRMRLPPPPPLQPQSVEALLRVINATIAKTPIMSLPDDLIEAHGRHIFDMCDALSGKQVPGRVQRLTSVKKEQYVQLVQQYTEMLTFLKSCGALLHHVQPESLLAQDDYLRAKEAADVHAAAGAGDEEPRSAASLAQRRQELEEEWITVAMDAWSTVLYQMVKVFVLNRVNMKSFRALPTVRAAAAEAQAAAAQAAAAQQGSGSRLRRSPTPASNSRARDPPDGTLTGSNLYSTSENLLLKWLTMHVAHVGGPPSPKAVAAKKNKQQAPPAPRVQNFDADLCDGSVLCHLLLAHVPTLADEGKALHQFYPLGMATDEARADHNCKQFVLALQALGLDYGVSTSQLRYPSPRDNLLLLLYLWQHLPQFLPKTTIEFRGALGQPVRKAIELRNPSKRAITYHVALEGSADFRIPDSTLSLEPGGSESFVVEFSPRFSREVTGRLTFRSHREGGGVGAATMVFLLKSAVSARSAAKTLTVATPCYEAAMVEVEVTNPFSVDCTFGITRLQERVDSGSSAAEVELDDGQPAPLGLSSASATAMPAVLALNLNAQLAGSGTGATRSTARTAASRMDDKDLGLVMEPFWTRVSQLRVKAGGSAVLQVQFLPFQMGNYKLQLVFLDENVGEFLYEVQGSSTAPGPLDTLRFSCEVKSQVLKDMAVPGRNLALERAKMAIVERLSGSFKGKVRDALRAQEAEDRPAAAYKVEINSPYFSGPPEALIAVTGKRPGQNKVADRASLATPRGAVSDGRNRLPITFHPKAAGTYPCKLTLRSALDTRVYEIEATAMSPGVKTVLEFVSPARQAIVQDIPIVNGSSQDWVLRGQVTGSSSFMGPPTLVVPKHGQATFPLTFRPSWVCEEEGELVLVNSSTNERFEYSLRGTGEEPLAEDHVSISCQARDRIQHTFAVENWSSQTTVYNVESDLPHVSGDSSVEVAGNGRGEYTLTIHPQLGGTYTGSVTFISPQREFLWYTVEVTASSPAPEATLDIQAFVRKAVAVEISLANPLDDAIEFEVVTHGAGLIGEESFTLEGGMTDTYELLYSPLVPGVQTGAVSFVNDRVGEFWYQLNLTADAAPPVRLTDMTCAVGATVTQPVELENPTGEEVTLVSRVDNRQNFSISPPQITLEPYSSGTANVRYTPSSLTDAEHGVVTFVHPRLGEWVYDVTGRGQPPSVMESTTVISPVGERSSSLVSFRNPFSTPLAISVGLVAEAGSEDDFALLLKRPRNQLAPFATLQIPLAFSPQDIAERHATVEVVASDSLSWQYPVIGVAEALPSDVRFKFSCAARSTADEPLTVVLPGLQEFDGVESFSHDLIVPSEELQLVVSRALEITPVQTEITSPDQPLMWNVEFSPLRPFTCPVEFVVNRKSGGRWRFEVMLEATEPEVDDVIVIESTLNRTSSVSFMLSNQFPSYSRFTAQFSTDSPLAFSVFPQSGMLPPYGREGTRFVLSFTPTEYGKTQTGRLMITTDEMQWTYEVRGTHPQYQVPVMTSKISTRLEPELAHQLAAAARPRKNIMRHNMSKTGLATTKARITAKPRSPHRR